MKLALGLLVLTACGDDGGTTDAQAPACIGLAATREIHASARMYGAADGAFAGDLCVEDHPELPCAKTTDADGHFTLCGPASGALAIRAKQSGFEPAVFLVGAGAVPPEAVLLIGDDDTLKQRYYDPLAATYPPKFSTNIVVSLFEGTAALANATIRLTPDPSKPVSYLDAAGLLDQSLQATSPGGRALVADSAPNMFTAGVKVGAQTRTCTNYLGGGDATFTALGGRDVNVMLLCTP